VTSQLDIVIRHQTVFRHHIHEESLVDLQLYTPQLRYSRDSASSHYHGLAQSWYNERRDGRRSPQERRLRIRPS
jgi:hypothetical protein